MTMTREELARERDTTVAIAALGMRVLNHDEVRVVLEATGRWAGHIGMPVDELLIGMAAGRVVSIVYDYIESMVREENERPEWANRLMSLVLREEVIPDRTGPVLDQEDLLRRCAKADITLVRG